MIGNASCGRTRTDFCVRIGVASLAADKIHCINFLSAPNTNTGPTNRESRKGIPEADNGPGITRASDRAIQGLCLMLLPTLGSQYAQNRTRGTVSRVLINGQIVEATPGQQARLAVVEAQARDAIRRVQELDPKWQPTPSAYESVEGLIEAHRADARQATGRISELQSAGIGPGPFAGDSIPARGPDRDFVVMERANINRIGSETGCHTCGTMNPGTPLDNFVLDHQPPTAWNPLGRPQRLYPQC